MDRDNPELGQGFAPSSQRDVWPHIRHQSRQQLKGLADGLERRAAWPEQRRVREAWLDQIGIRAGQRVLEVGCGTGALARAAAARVAPGGEVVGIDPSPILLERARQLATEANLHGTLAFQEGTAEHTGVPAGSYDAVLAITVFSHLPRPAEALRGMIRATAPGGLVSVFDQDYYTLQFDHPDEATTARVVWANAAGVVDGAAGRKLARWLAEAGLEQIGVQAWAYTEYGRPRYLLGLAERGTAWAVDRGDLTAKAANTWLAELRAMGEAGRYFGTLMYIAAWGRVAS
ncbi:MAG: methyltransferase domain-containing protein [Chloroflexi bacterium]|nr:methyltransferase domain-containing protein [Chloroflexota bacterium]